jgi:hypothetical protein
MQIIESPFLVEQFRFPRSKKKRIRAKWAKRPANSRPARGVLQMGDKLICHPEFSAQLRRAIAAARSA